MKYLLPVLIGLNIVFGIAAYSGFFEGKDLLPILVGTLFILVGMVFLLIKRKSFIKSSLLGFVILALSSLAVVHVHFNVYSAQKVNNSRENSLETLKGNQAPEINYVQNYNMLGNSSISTYFKKHDYTILNFWATWCPPCLKEMPLLNDFYLANQKHNIGMIGFTDYSAKKGSEAALQKIKNAVEKLKVDYPILVDSSTQVRSAYKADVLPATVLIDRNGKVLDYQIGIEGAKKIIEYVNAH